MTDNTYTVKKRVWLVRHAESLTNAGHQWSNTVTNPLTEKGRQQALLLNEVLCEKPSLIVTSPYIRTKETAEPVLKKWPDVPHEEWPVQEYTQLCFETRGLLEEQEKRRLLDDFWHKGDPEYRDGPKAESFNMMIGRVDGLIENLKTAEYNKILVFTHGYFLNALFFRLENLHKNTISMEGLRQYKEGRRIPNTCIIHCTVSENGKIHEHSRSASHLPEDDVE